MSLVFTGSLPTELNGGGNEGGAVGLAFSLVIVVFAVVEEETGFASDAALVSEVNGNRLEESLYCMRYLLNPRVDGAGEEASPPSYLWYWQRRLF